MANFVLVFDGNGARRDRFIETVETFVAPVDGLVRNNCDQGDFSAVWAAAEIAPISCRSEEDRAAIVWGEARRIDNSRPVDAKELLALWCNAERSVPPILDGFHAAVAIDGLGTTVGADPLGIFPVYYYATENLLLVGSSSELLRHHESFPGNFNPAGLVGILLTNGLVEGQTLMRGIQRLQAGSLLKWQPGTSAKEVAQYSIPLETTYYDLPFSAQVSLLDREIEHAVRRHAFDGRRLGLLLSGGRDSRLLAGYLHRAGVDVAACTFGTATDIDMRCAKRVARRLGFDHAAADVSYDDYPQCAALSAKWEWLAGGFNNITDWRVLSKQETMAPRSVMGALTDAVIGGSSIDLAYCAESQCLSFERMFSAMNSRGINPVTLKKLLRAEVFGDLVDETVERCKASYEQCPGNAAQRAFIFGLKHRERFHVGSMAWVYSFWSWPVIPTSDCELLEFAVALPASSLAERRAQNGIMCTRFPQLASLPLDRTNYDTTPLMMGPRQLLWRHALSPLRRVQRFLPNLGRQSQREHRYYHRIWDLNNAGWGEVRRSAASKQQVAEPFFNMDFFNQLVRGPDHVYEFRNVLSEASGLKSLLGFLFWGEQHL